MGKLRKPELGRLDSLPWRNKLDDSFPFVGGSEGGFLSLEEIDATEYTLGITDPPSGNSKRKKAGKEKKRKRENVDNGRDSNVINTADEDKGVAEDKYVKKKNKNQKKKKKPKKVKDVIDNQVQDVEDDVEEVDEAEYYAWNDLRLHPLLRKSIHYLGFKEPTPIQKACIPAAAHHGKDVIGAAETGSGKTLAFGLPILQRLLEEQEKATSLFSADGDAVERIAPRHLLRALIVTPTRELALQVTNHLKEAAKCTNIRVVSIVGGMSTQKQERLLKARPEVIVGTPGRLWELMSGGESHLVELHSLSFFVLDEADRMIENGHFRELHSIIDMLPMTSGPNGAPPQDSQNCTTVSNLSRKKRQTLVFSATIALSSDFRKKLKRGSLKSKQSVNDDLTSIETLSERAGMRADAAIVDLTNASIMANKLVESFLECREDDKDAYLYYLLHVHGQGRIIVFCSSVAALRHVSSLCHILGVSVGTLHSQMQQRARLKAIDRFRKNEHGVLVATDIAARGLDIPGVRTVVHYQLPHSAEVYVHRSGRTARAFADGCSVALISPNDRFKFASLCKSFSRETFQRFPVESSYIPEVIKRLSLARQIDKISRRESKEKATDNWVKRSAESVEMVLEDTDSEDERVSSHKQKKATLVHLKNLQQELGRLLSRPLQPKTFSHRFLAGAGVSPMLQGQLEELVQQKKLDHEKTSGESADGKLVVIGHDRVEPLHALMRAGSEVRVDMKELAEKQRSMDSLRKKRKEQKKRQREQRRKEKKRLKAGSD